jgi:hypothetical protein
VAVTPLRINRANSLTSIAEALTIAEASSGVISYAGHATAGRQEELLLLSSKSVPAIEKLVVHVVVVGAGTMGLAAFYIPQRPGIQRST